MTESNPPGPERPSSADDPLIAQLVADRYRILSAVGEGGMGRVYLAEHVRLGRKCAVKVINRVLATTSDAVSRFNREASNACKINHPNVAQVYDFGEMADGTLYLAMEYVDGETLDAVISRQGPLPAPRAASITKQIADALYAAHHLGIVHRDLKPENVMVAKHLDGTDWVKVVDFGIAKTVQRDGSGSQTVTTAGVSLGTPEYMSPEQLAGETLDHRTDIYSLGLLLFNTLTGELPYPKVTSKETLVRRLISRPRTLAEVEPKITWPAALQQALDRALAPEVGDRYDSVAEFGRAVVQAVGQPPSAVTAAATVVSERAVRPTMERRAPNAAPAPERPFSRRVLRWAGSAAAVFVALSVLHAFRARSSATPAAIAILPQAVPRPTPAPLPPAPDTTPRHTTVTTSDRTPSRPVSHRPTPAVPNVKHAVDSLSERELPPDASPEARSAAAARAIREHVARMDQRFIAGDTRGARQELGEALSELAIVRELDPNAERAVELQREIGRGVRELVASCYRMRADSTLAPGIRCENLNPGANRLREYRRPR
jgi:serine/threonine protein kinase